ncbi:MAG: hypothetical protein M5U14_13065 [Acidimicrobiia bacterium]|nr:hypothetical protein [Acidimicrobiia bacterium]
MKVCLECGSEVNVHRGLCRSCRERAQGRGEAVAEDTNLEHLPPEPDVEPAHDRPWVARSAFTGRTRRSPRT